MLALLLPIAFATGLQEGDSWVSELTVRCVQQAEKIDSRRVSRLLYSVIGVTAEFTTINVDVSPIPDDKSKPVRQVLVFNSGGVLVNRENTTNLDLARVRRMEWTAAEPRQGISWSRNWPAKSDLLESKVTVKPTMRTEKDVTMLVNYLESGKSKATATVKVVAGLPIIEDFEGTIMGSSVPGAKKPAVLIVSENLKELHLR